MNQTITTGRAALIHDTSEPRLNDLVRRRKIDPAPPVVSGRRVWAMEHLIQAGARLAVAPEEVRRRVVRFAESHESRELGQ